MKITYNLDRNLSTPEIDLLKRILYRRDFGEDESSFDLDLFYDGYLREMVSRYLSNRHALDYLDNYDEYEERLSAKFKCERLRLILEQFMSGQTIAIEVKE